MPCEEKLSAVITSLPELKMDWISHLSNDLLVNTLNNNWSNFFTFFFVVLGLEPKALCVPGKLFSTELHL